MANGFCRQHGGDDHVTRQDDTSPEAIKAASLARFAEREERNGNLSGFNKRMDIDLDLFKQIHPGMVPHWFNDDGGKLSQKYNIGWAFVPADDRIAVGDPVTGGGNTDIAGRISVIASKDSSKPEGAMRAVLMMIPEEIHAKIVAAKQKRNDAKDEEINRLVRGQATEGQAGVVGAYQPEDTEPSGVYRS
jgi:hypothetical protein